MQKNRIVTSSILIIFSFFSVVYSYLNTRPLSVGDYCGYDGRIYCLMANGDTVFEPYSRRTLLPYVISLLSNKPDYLTFYFINTLFVIFSLFLMYIFQQKNDNLIKLVVITTFLINPFTLRMLFSSPVLVDFLALTLVLLVIFLYTLQNRFLTKILVLILLSMLVFVRENISITFAFSVFLVDLFYFLKARNTKKFPLWELNQFFLISAVTFFAFQQPNISAPSYVPKTGILDVITYWTTDIFLTFDYFLRFIYLVILGLGVFGIFGLLKIYSFRSINQTDQTILVFGTLLTLTSLILGGDTSRILMIPGIVFTLILFRQKVKIKNLSLLFMINLILWNPLNYSNGEESSYLELYGQRYLDPSVAIGQFREFLLTATLIFLVHLMYLFFRKVNKDPRPPESPISLVH